MCNNSCFHNEPPIKNLEILSHNCDRIKRYSWLRTYTNTVISYVLNVLVLLALKPLNVSWDFIAGNMVAFILSVLWSFYWNNRFVFTVQEGQHRSIWRALLKTYVAYGFTGIILNNILSWLWINVLDISKFIAPLINLIISVPVNFIINKMWAFKTEK